MLAEKNIYIQSAYKTLQVISQDDQKRMEYEAREKAIRDYNQGLLEARESGKEEGRKEGREEGRKEGREVGEHEKAIQIAQNMLLENFDTCIIARISGLSLKEIEELKN